MMQTKRRGLFRELQPENWQNLGLAAILALYLIYFALELALGRLCGQIGVDYCDFWSAGRVANTHGYRAVYDLGLLHSVQRSILPREADPTRIAVVPFPYLPIFVPPFQLLALLPPLPGFAFWSLVNLLGFWAYMRFFGRSLDPQHSSARLRLMMLGSLPFFINLFSGQVSVFLAICVGEFLRESVGGRSLRAGLWLGGLALKPQLLILLAPLLLLHRSFRTITGLLVSSGLIVLASIALVGADGLLDVLGLWRLYAQGGASNWIEGMLNFRMLGLHLTPVLPPWLSWTMVGLGTVAVITLTVLAWRSPLVSRPASLSVALLGIMAATVSVAWHSHIHMAMVFIPSLLYLAGADRLPRRLLNAWVFVPSGLFLVAVFLPPALARAGVIANPGATYVYFLFAAAQLAVNLLLFDWALRRSPQKA